MINTIKNRCVNLWIRNHFFMGILAFLHMGMFLTSCEENISDALPADGNIAYVNFANLGEALLYDTLYLNNYVYINDSVNNPPFNNYNVINNPAVFTYAPTLDIREYPTQMSHVGTGAGDNNSGSGIYWLPVEAGDYRFIFTSRDRTYLIAENKTLDKQTYHTLYLAESAVTDSSYAIVDVPIQRIDKLEGSATVQFVNLSPDAGEVEVYRVDAGGNEILTATEPLAFGQYQSAALAIEGTENTYNSILLRFRAAEGGDLVSFAVPANEGAVYTVLLRGFAQQTMRKIKKDNYSYAEVNIMPDLRASVRRVFY